MAARHRLQGVCLARLTACTLHGISTQAKYMCVSASTRACVHVCTDMSALQRKCIAERDEAVAKLEAAQADLAQERARCMGCMVNACGHEPCHAFVDLEAQKNGRPLDACKFVYRVMVDILWQPAACKQVHVPMCHAVCK